MCDFCKDICTDEKAYQREWYLKNREKILAKRKAKGDMKQPLGGQVK